MSDLGRMIVGMLMTPYERYCWVCWKSGKCVRWAARISVKHAGNAAPLAGVGLVGWVLFLLGHDMDQPGNVLDMVGQAALFIGVAAAMLFLVALIVSPIFVDRDVQKYGSKRVYREPRLAFHKYVGPSDNGKDFVFRFPDAAPFSLVEYNIAPDTALRLVGVHVAASRAQMGSMAMMPQHTRGAIRVGRRRELCCRMNIKPKMTPFSVRIYVTGWDEGAGKEFQHKPPDAARALAVLSWLKS